jgi:SAM-dependent methyltransferase
MTVQGEQAAEIWRDPEFARAWIDYDDQGDLLDLPRKLAAALVAHDRPRTRLVVDVASGPGAFLEVFLDAFPRARGVWSDASPTMMEEARRNLARFGDRVEYVLADMTDLPGSGLPDGADVVCSSRASHHLDRPTLLAYYRQAAGLLRPGGWLVNLDHFGTSDTWNERLRAVKKRFTTRERDSADRPRHHHDHPLCTVSDHLDGYAEAGVTDVATPWQAFYTVLLAGRTSGQA